MSLQRGILLGSAFGALSAALLILSFPPYDLWPLILAALVPMILAQHRLLPPRFSGLAVGLAIGGFFWGYFGDMFSGGPWFMRWLPWIVGLAAALIGSRERAFHERTGYRWFVLQGAFLWVGIEMIRGSLPAIGTWGFIGYALYAQPWLIQPVSVFGIYGLDLLILLVNYALAMLAIVLFDARWPRTASAPISISQSTRWLLIVGALLSAWAAASILAYRSFRPGPSRRVVAIQPGFKVQSEEGLQRLLDLSRRAAEEGAQLIVWHEGALPFDPQDAHSGTLRAFTAETEAYLAIGYVVRSDQSVRNEATLLSPDGRFLGVYGKDHPVVFAGERSPTRGAYPVAETPLGRIGMIICYDLDFTDTARRVARNGAQVVAVPSFDWPAAAEKHYTHLVFRAVENRVAMIKADAAFDSAIIDPVGRVLRRKVATEPGAALLIADLPLGTADAPATRLGDWIGWICLAGMGGFILEDVRTALRSI